MSGKLLLSKINNFLLKEHLCCEMQMQNKKNKEIIQMYIHDEFSCLWVLEEV